MDYEPVIGLEVHIQLNTRSKMFCGCSNNAVGAEQNTLVCPVCFGMPGTLPVTNLEAVRKTLILGKALESKISNEWNFERKNYFYPDLPKGYQITSSTNPPLIGGQVGYLSDSEQNMGIVRIHHVHLEEDAGKLVHGDDGYSYVDLNRAGTPLIELVTEPDIDSASHARLFLQEVQVLVRRLCISEGDMENGHLRCDANISIRQRGTKKLGTRVEVKNLNSFQSVEKAIMYEQRRQIDLLKSGKSVVQETRGWDENKLVTKGHRQKEEIHDYRYMPEPDIPPIRRNDVSQFSDAKLLKALPELPNQFRKRMRDVYGMTYEQVQYCLIDTHLGKFTEDTLELLSQNPSLVELARKLLFADLRRVATENAIQLKNIHITPKTMALLVQNINDGTLTHQLFKTHLHGLLIGAVSFNELLNQSKESSSINTQQIVTSVLQAHPEVVQQWHSGNQKVLGFLVGQVMLQSKGSADPRKVNQILLKELKDQ